jgi:hypothetical protein
MRRTRIRPVSDRRRRRDKVYGTRRVQVMTRSGGLCEAPVHTIGCSGRCEQIHHRGGRVGPDPHRLDNLLGVSVACHRAAHGSPLWAYATGLSVRRNGADDEGEAYGGAL